MGMNSEVILFGTFHKDIQEHLDNKEKYTDVPEGTPVLVRLFDCQGTLCSMELAASLGINNVSDPAQCAINHWQILRQKEALEVFAEEYNYRTEVARLFELVKGGFTPIFCPN